MEIYRLNKIQSQKAAKILGIKPGEALPVIIHLPDANSKALESVSVLEAGGRRIGKITIGQALKL